MKHNNALQLRGFNILVYYVACYSAAALVGAITTAMTQASVNSMRGDESPFYTFAYSVCVVLSVYSWTRQVTELS